MFDIVDRFPDKAWLDETAAKLDQKLLYAVGKAREKQFIPYSANENGFNPNYYIHNWTNGFWPAMMWQMYLGTKNETYREEAIRTEEMLDAALTDFKELYHDVGFMWLIHSAVRYKLEGNQDSYDRAIFAAYTLAARFNPKGFIRAWNNEGRQGWAIIDCMMNLPLLYWASDVTDDPRFRLIAMKHADTAMEHFIRADGSVKHIVVFDPMTGEELDDLGGQGYAKGSSWSRGQAWALYGFTLSYLATGKQAYLNAAKRVAGYFIANVADDFIPRCDFRQPAQPDLKDNAAGSIAACGLLQLAKAVPECEARPFYDAAVKMLMAMEKHCTNWDNNVPAVLNKCTVAYHEYPGRHSTMNYADYYFVEAINMLRGQKLNFWLPTKD